MNERHGAFLAAILVVLLGGIAAAEPPKMKMTTPVPGKGWNMLLRLYGPLQPWFEKTWRPGDPARVE